MTNLDEIISESCPGMPETDLPCPVTKGTPDAAFKCGDGRVSVRFTGVSEEEYSAYIDELERNGYAVYVRESLEANRFATLTGRFEIRLSYFPARESGELRIHISREKTNLPGITTPEYTEKCPVFLCQIGRYLMENKPFGMSYVTRCADGSFFIIDGGPSNADDELNLLQFLKKNSPRAGKPEVRWLITHAHMDHMRLPNSFMGKYHSEIDLKTVYYNFPDFENTFFDHEDAKKGDSISMVAEFKSKTAEYFPEAETVILHTGQHIYLPGCTLEILFTFEEYWPLPFKWINYTSVALRMIFPGDRSALIMGDCEHHILDHLMLIYGDSLRNDILQVTHHGYSGGNIEFYSLVSPSICLWPIDRDKFENDPRRLGTHPDCTFNMYLRSLPGCVHYHSSDTVTITFPDMSTTVEPYDTNI